MFDCLAASTLVWLRDDPFDPTITQAPPAVPIRRAFLESLPC